MRNGPVVKRKQNVSTKAKAVGQMFRNLSGRAPAVLVLSDGAVFQGYAMGARGQTIGEVVFNTGMTGYQEVLTDPSYKGQVVTFTSPHIGNYGVNGDDGESLQINAVGAVVRSLSRRKSNHRATMGFEEWLIDQEVVGITEVDTRALTRHLREQGVTMGMIAQGKTVEDAPALLEELSKQPDYESVDYVEAVACEEPLRVIAAGGDPWRGALSFEPWQEGVERSGPEVVVIDFGVKHNILRHLLSRGMAVTLVPRDVEEKELERINPRGILFSNGPGDPARLREWLPRIKRISLRYPTMGICLGHQLLASAFGGETFKLRYGHRGPNQPVQDSRTGKVSITSQNHGFSVVRESFPEELEVTEVNLNDETVAGFRHRDHQIVAVQYHPEAGPGPADGVGFFDEFVKMLG